MSQIKDVVTSSKQTLIGIKNLFQVELPSVSTALLSGFCLHHRSRRRHRRHHRSRRRRRRRHRRRRFEMARCQLAK